MALWTHPANHDTETIAFTGIDSLGQRFPVAGCTAKLHLTPTKLAQHVGSVFGINWVMVGEIDEDSTRGQMTL